jgi:hypothetical protein
MRKSPFVLLLLIMVSGLCSAQQGSPIPWTKLQFLVGTWNAAGSGSPGEGAGVFSFSFDLQKRLLVRRSHTDYPAASNRAAFAHDDLMIIYADDQQLFHADYYDNEGHVIRYTLQFSADGNTWTFVSDTLASRPRFRLTYSKTSEAELKIKFEIAPPDQPDAFKKYVEGTAHRN